MPREQRWAQRAGRAWRSETRPFTHRRPPCRRLPNVTLRPGNLPATYRFWASLRANNYSKLSIHSNGWKLDHSPGIAARTRLPRPGHSRRTGRQRRRWTEVMPRGSRCPTGSAEAPHQTYQHPTHDKPKGRREAVVNHDAHPGVGRSEQAAHAQLETVRPVRHELGDAVGRVRVT